MDARDSPSAIHDRAVSADGRGEAVSRKLLNFARATELPIDGSRYQPVTVPMSLGQVTIRSTTTRNRDRALLNC